MLKRKFILILCLVFLCQVTGCSVSRGVKSADRPDSRRKGKFWRTKIVDPSRKLTVGETYIYKVRWLGINVGDAQLSIKEKLEMDGRQVYHVILTARTNKFFSFFYKVNGNVESFVDATDFKPVRYNSETTINKKFVFKKMDYDFNSKVVRAEDRKGHYEIEITDDVLDPLGIFYYFRLNSVKLEKPVTLLINAGKRNFSVTVYVRKVRRLGVPAGKFWAFLVEPTPASARQFDDVLNASGNMLIWFSSDERRIPLIITLKIPIGTAQAILTKIKYPTPEPEKKIK